MSKTGSASAAEIARSNEAGIQVVTLAQPGHTEYFLNVVPGNGESESELFGRAATALRDCGAAIISQEIFGGGAQSRDAVEKAFGKIQWPLTWVDESVNTAAPAGIHLWAASGLDIQPVELDGAVIGSVFDDGAARHCRLGGLEPADAAIARETAAEAIFDTMSRGLDVAGLSWQDVLRTWFYNRSLLEWYDEFNGIRDAFFKKHGVFDGLVPASTGISGGFGEGPALVGGLLAVRGDGAELEAVPSPLQCPALEYGSSFSRATELRLPGHRRLYVSGTASIEPGGDTVHVDDTDAQIALTMDVVEAILDSRNMGWGDVSRAIAYFKHADEFSAWDRCCAARELPIMPVMVVHDDICRHDLLFEIELDAIVID